MMANTPTKSNFKSKRHAVLLSLIFLLKCFSKSFFIKSNLPQIV